MSNSNENPNNPDLNNPDRLAVLRDWTLTRQETELACTRTASLAARMFSLPMAYVTLVGQRGFRIAGSHGLPLLREKHLLPERLETVWPSGFTQSADPSTLAGISELLATCCGQPSSKSTQVTWQEGAYTVNAPIGYHAIVPLLHPDGHVLGGLSVLGHVPCHFWVDEVSMLEDLAETLVCELEARANNAIWRMRRAPSIAEANLLAIIESTQEAIITTALDGTIKSWNPAAERLFGHSARAALERSINLIVPSGSQDRFQAHLDRVAKGEHIAVFETRYMHQLGHTLPVRVNIAPIMGTNGRVIGASSFCNAIFQEQPPPERSYRTGSQSSSVINDLYGMVLAASLQGRGK